MSASQDRIAWLKKRKEGVGSSDAPMLMGEHKYGTPLDLYNDKISDTVDEGSSYITDKGNAAEVRMRSLLEIHFNQSFAPAICQMEGYEYLMASLDGRSEDKKSGMECKLLSVIDSRGPVNKEAEGYRKWHLAKTQGEIPEMHFIQMQHQFMVADLDRIYYVGYREDKAKTQIEWEDLAIVEVKPDHAFIKKLFAVETKFWTQNVLKRIPPSASDDDYVQLKGMDTALEAWKKQKEIIDDATEQLEKLRDWIIKEAEKQKHLKYESAGVRVVQVSRIGAIDYSKIELLKNVDLDKYRKKGSISWKLEALSGS